MREECITEDEFFKELAALHYRIAKMKRMGMEGYWEKLMQINKEDDIAREPTSLFFSDNQNKTDVRYSEAPRPQDGATRRWRNGWLLLNIMADS